MEIDFYMDIGPETLITIIIICAITFISIAWLFTKKVKNENIRNNQPDNTGNKD